MFATQWKLPALCWRQIRLARYSMPKIVPLIVDSVFYLFCRNPKTGEIDGPDGTGFIVGRNSAAGRGDTHYYAVTNRHLACDGTSMLRVNKRGGGSRFIETEPHEWEFFPQSDDLAIADITDEVDINGDEISCLMESMFITPGVIQQFSIMGGTDTFMCGLFYSHPGEADRNTPAFRFGNISVLANEKARVEIEETGGSCASHLVDTRSRSGFSGSPVIAYRVVGSDLSRIPMVWDRPPGQTFLVSSPLDQFVGLLGVHCGQFWDEIKFRKSRKSEKADDIVKEGDDIEIQSSMTIVVPAWRITDLLNLEVFEMARQSRDTARADRRAKRPRPESVKRDRPSDDADPNHRDRFTALLNVAAKKLEPKD